MAGKIPVVLDEQNEKAVAVVFTKIHFGHLSYLNILYKFEDMNENNVNTTIVDGYIELLENLSAGNKLDLISKLSSSIKEDLIAKTSSFKQAFGAFDSEKTAEEIVEELRSSRVFTRQIEPF